MSDQHKYKNFISEIPSTAVEVYRMLPEGTRCEVIFNELIMSPSPSSLHQLLLSDLHVLIYSFIKERNLGKVILSPFDVYFEAYDSAVQPDLMVLLNENLNKIGKDGLYGAPDIVIEILSQNRAYDTKRKKALYEKAGVKEYFMIDPENKITTLLTLNSSGVYEQTYEETGVLNSAILSCKLTF
ncbi:Uma2 family endonuclease [Mucilaginibacter sp. BJC16-A38]|uniref:Uma2 family endonuclease n=1 Tax=Mucilaginibacter phenanthrenivorans TaxID=1234842 RepID=UPI0021574B72|nr:Uma2 family endonuclease [Mucilaginibacter phenanthrenivorans]MCR8557657.1 Uma2 family endonuclease [Mucilaginibacter phenanthrenivorans]